MFAVPAVFAGLGAPADVVQLHVVSDAARNLLASSRVHEGALGDYYSLRIKRDDVLISPGLQEELSYLLFFSSNLEISKNSSLGVWSFGLPLWRN